MKHVTLYSAEPAKGWMPWGALAPVLCIVLVAIPAIVTMLALQSFHLVNDEGDPTSTIGFVWFILVTFVLIGAVFLGWSRLVEKRPPSTIGLTGVHPGRTFLRGLAVGVAMSAAVVAAIWLSGGYRAAGFAPALASVSTLLWIGALFAGFAVQSSVEEIVFRGWLLSGIARKLNVPIAVLLVSVTFMFLHYERGQHWATTTTTFLFSLFLCAWALRSGNIWGVMGWHAGWNWLLAVGFELPVTGLSAGVPALLVRLIPLKGVLVTGGHQGPEGSLWCSVFLVAGIAFQLLRPRHAPPAAVPLEEAA